jgi:hypothetical protein
MPPEEATRKSFEGRGCEVKCFGLHREKFRKQNIQVDLTTPVRSQIVNSNLTYDSSKWNSQSIPNLPVFKGQITVLPQLCSLN